MRERSAASANVDEQMDAAPIVLPANRRVLLPAEAPFSYFHPAHVPRGNRRRKRATAADSRSRTWIKYRGAGIFGARGYRAPEPRLRFDKTTQLWSRLSAHV